MDDRPWMTRPSLAWRVSEGLSTREHFSWARFDQTDPHTDSQCRPDAVAHGCTTQDGGPTVNSKNKIRVLVGGQAVAAVLAILLFTQPGIWSNLVGWTLGAVLVSAFFASKNQIAVAQGRRAAHYIGLDRASSVILAVGMSAAFAHAFFIATELAK